MIDNCPRGIISAHSQVTAFGSSWLYHLRPDGAVWTGTVGRHSSASSIIASSYVTSSGCSGGGCAAGGLAFWPIT